MSKPLDIRKVPVDVGSTEVKSVYNPLSVDFVHPFDGDPITIPSEGFKTLPENIARHMARHLAKRIVMALGEEEREETMKTLSEEKRITMAMKPIPRFAYKVGDLAKMLVMDTRDEQAIPDEKIIAVAKDNKAKKDEVSREMQKAPVVKLGDKKGKGKAKLEK